MSLRVAIVVQGRFHAFDVARALGEAGHDVTVLTNYPRWAVARFGLDPRRVRSLWPHGVAERVLRRAAVIGVPQAEALMHRAFGAWAARSLAGPRWDLVLAFSGVAEELLRSHAVLGLKTVVRGSCHIRVQDRLLREEEARAGAPIDRPSTWRLAREEREYALADRVLVLSSFARRTFLDEGVSAERLWLNPLALPVESFSPGAATVQERTRRLSRPGPLRVLTVGRMCFQKGLLDFAEVCRALEPTDASFRVVGTIQPEARALCDQLAARVDFHPACPRSKLGPHFAWADVFLLPTIQDGFALVLAEAIAAGIPVITTHNSGGPDLLALDARYGALVPIRDPGAIVDQLRSLQADRPALALRTAEVSATPPRRTWADVGRDLVDYARSAGAGTA
jgi:glycosyltransferase involved in cell wall biosynthesis